jgi:hypothetical protein
VETTAELLERMRQTRRRVLGDLSKVTSKQLEAPSKYKEMEVNVRFHFYHLLSHEIEHTVHLAQTLSAQGIKQTEAQLILARLQAARAELEGMLIGLPDDALDRVPGPGQWPIRQILEHTLKAEESHLKRIEDSLAKT